MKFSYWSYRWKTRGWRRPPLPPSPSVHNVPMCTGTTRTHVETCVRVVHTGAFWTYTQGFSSVSHHTPHTETEPERDRETRQDKTRQNKRREEGEEMKKARENQERYDVLCVCLCGFDFSCFFFFKITRPSNNFDFSKLPLPTLKAFFSPCNVLFVQLAN